MKKNFFFFIISFFILSQDGRCDQAEKSPPKPGVNFTNQFGIEMVWIPALKSWAGKFEVTQGEYEKITGKKPKWETDPRLPANDVTFAEALDFCKKLTALETAAGTLPSGMVYSVPTEKQWETLVGDARLEDAVCNLTPQKHDSADRVGSKRPNNMGLYDVRGNVWEWCVESTKSNVSGHVARGGSWGTDDVNRMQVSYRLTTRFISFGEFGLRVILTPVAN